VGGASDSLTLDDDENHEKIFFEREVENKSLEFKEVIRIFVY